MFINFKKKTNNQIKKKGKIFEDTFHQRRHMDAEQAYEKMLHVVSHEGDAD